MKKNIEKPRLTSETPCFECEHGRLAGADVQLTGERNGENFVIQMPGLRCGSCGFETIDSVESAEFTRLVSDAYREKHGLLTGVEIRARREQLKMSQQPFAEYLGVGVASVKRWELGQVQDKAMDELIRLKTDPEAARNNLRALESQVPEQHILSSTKVGDVDVDLLFMLEQTYRRQTKMKMDRFGMDSVFSEDELLAA
jgi:putative zinc finger/helix-turn-helix YgiT family protein